MRPFASLIRNLIFTLLLMLVTFAPVTTLAQSGAPESIPVTPVSPLRFSSISLDEGLSQSVVNVTFQDSQGYLWFGTQDGLNRYDGYHFTVFQPDPDDPTSISDRGINSITEDAQGNLWIGTTLGGLNRYDRLTGEFSHLLHDDNNPDSLSGNCVRALYIDQDDLLWVGSDGGLDVIDPEKNSFLAHYQHDPKDPASLLHNGINDLYQDRTGLLWIASEGGLSYRNKADGTFVHFTHDPNDPTSIIGSSINQIYEDQNDDIWLGTDKGLERFHRRGGTFWHYLPDPGIPGALSNASVEAILVDRNGNLWVGTSDGLNLLNRQSGYFTAYRHNPGDPNSLGNSNITSLYEDREGILWIGTFGGGLNKFDRNHNKFPILQYDPGNPMDIRSFGVLEDHTGELWFTLYGEGLLRLDRESGVYRMYRHNPDDPDNSLLDNFVWTVSESRDGTIWIGGRQGLNALNPKTGQFTLYRGNENGQGDPTSLGGLTVGFTMEDSQDVLWIAMPTGLDSFDRQTGIFTHYRYDPNNPTSLSHPNVSYIFESQPGDIWLGMYEGGLSKLDRETGQFTHYRYDPSDPNSISNDSVLMIMQDHTGVMWIGTQGGLNKFDPQSGTAIPYSVKDGLPNDVIYAIVEDDDGYLWLSTNNGLSRFDPRTGEAQNFDFNDGLQSNEFNSFAFAKTSKGEIIFSGIAGTNIFRPDQILDNMYVPPVVLTRLTQAGEPINGEPITTNLQEVTLRWPYNYFEFEFSALSYSNPEKNQYAYQLENFDQDWIANGTSNSGRYTNLPGGTYTLRLKGSNSDGLWNEYNKALTVKVIPPVWQTWWFRILGVSFAAAGVFALYRIRMHNVESYNRDLERQVEERTREIEALFEQTKELAIIEERNRLARDLHDSAKQKAFAALAQLGAVRSMIASDPNLAKKHLNEVEDLVYEVIQELTFLIQEMYPMALKEKGLVTILFEYLYEWENRTDIHVNLHVEHEQRLPLEVEQALYRIVQESLANVARHSQASKVNIELQYNFDHVTMVLNDNGCGFDLNQQPGGVGLRTMRERTILIGGSIDIESSPGNGTKIQVSVPIQPDDKLTGNGSNGGQHGSPNNHTDRG